MRRHPRARRLQVVLDLTEREEQQALSQWGALQQKLAAEQEQRQQLLTYSLEYQQKISAPSSTAVSAGQIHNTIGFMGQIEQAINAQQQQIALLQKQTDNARQHYLALHGKVKALQELIERLELEAAQVADKEAQKQSDEWASRNAARSSPYR